MQISIEHLWKQKKILNDAGQLTELTILSDISIEFCGTCIQMILGPSGSGKTTLLRLLNKLESPSRGKILYNGNDMNSIPPRELRKEVGMVFQSPSLFRGTIFENVSYGPNLFKQEMSREQVKQLLKIVDLDGIEPNRDVDNLSLGQQQRVSFARALANQPKVLLLDEPTSALDPSSSNNILDLIKRINQELGISIIMVTHIMEHAKKIADDICLLVEGKIIEKGKAAPFFKQPETEIARKFVKGEL